MLGIGDYVRRFTAPFALMLAMFAPAAWSQSVDTGGASPDRVAQSKPALSASASRGQYVFRVSGCLTCHTKAAEDAVPLAGGRALKTPFGEFYSPNITSHPEHGIGRWQLEDFRTALRDGVAPDGGDYYPVFPYTSYTRMRDADIADLFAYLRSVEPAAVANTEHNIPWFVQWRFLNWLWKLVFFDNGAYASDSNQSASWNRGAYVSSAFAHCSECHSPRGSLSGAIDAELAMSGAVDGPEGESAPNITPDAETGIGAWDKIDLTAYLETGETPDGDYAGGLMAEVIDNGLLFLTTSDRDALVEYLSTLAPIHRPELAH